MIPETTPPSDDIGNEPPTADAGDHQTVDEGDTVLLDGSYSSDTDDGIKTYQWEQIEGTPVELSDSNAIEPSYICQAVGANGDTLTFRLTVTDFSDGAASDVVKIYVNDIDDPGEELLQSSSTDTISERITIPTAALEGNTRLRVSMGGYGYPYSCGNRYAGEVED